MLAGAASFPQPDGWPAISTAEHSTEILGPGVTYDRWQLQTALGPLAVHVTSIDLRNPLVTLNVATQRGVLVGPGEALSSMADRAHAEAAINGDYFDINESGSPLNVVVTAARIEHQPDGAAALVIGPGNAVAFEPVTFHATLQDQNGARIDAGAVNDWSRASDLSLLTAELGTNDAGPGDAAEIVLAPTADPTQYRVTGVASNLASLLLLGAGEWGVAARGPKAAQLAGFALQDLVTVSFDASPPLSSVVAAH